MSSLSLTNTPKSFSEGLPSLCSPPVWMDIRARLPRSRLRSCWTSWTSHGPLLELVQVPVDDIVSLRHVIHTTQLSVSCRLAEGALNPTVYIIAEDIKHYWSKYHCQGVITIWWFNYDAYEMSVTSEWKTQHIISNHFWFVKNELHLSWSLNSFKFI